METSKIQNKAPMMPRIDDLYIFPGKDASYLHSGDLARHWISSTKWLSNDLFKCAGQEMHNFPYNIYRGFCAIFSREYKPFKSGFTEKFFNEIRSID
jgi:hypothetical protein